MSSCPAATVLASAWLILLEVNLAPMIRALGTVGAGVSAGARIKVRYLAISRGGGLKCWRGKKNWSRSGKKTLSNRRSDHSGMPPKHICIGLPYAHPLQSMENDFFLTTRMPTVEHNGTQWIRGTNLEHQLHFKRISIYENCLMKSANLCTIFDLGWPLKKGIEVFLAKTSRYVYMLFLLWGYDCWTQEEFSSSF